MNDFFMLNVQKMLNPAPQSVDVNDIYHAEQKQLITNCIQHLFQNGKTSSNQLLPLFKGKNSPSTALRKFVRHGLINFTRGDYVKDCKRRLGFYEIAPGASLSSFGIAP
jgi:hypothetical protein